MYRYTNAIHAVSGVSPLCEDVRANVYRNPRNLISYGTLSVGSRMLSVRQRVIEGHKNMFRSIVRIATAEL